jgi:hypothetical protein
MMTIFASDDFNTLTATTELVGRVSTSGMVWTGDTGYYSGATGGGKITSSSSASRGAVLLGITPGINYIVSGIMKCNNTGKVPPWLLTRYQDANNLIFAGWLAGIWTIRKRSASVETQVDTDGSTTNNPTTDRTVDLIVSGISADPANIICTLKSDGVIVATAIINDTNLDAKGSAGIYNTSNEIGDVSSLDGWSASYFTPEYHIAS